MGNNTKKLSDLQDSKLLYEKELPLFGYILLVVICILLIALIAWSANANKPYIVKGNGVVESLNKNYVVAPFTGEISGFNLEEGEYVHFGEVLFKIKSTDLDVQNEQLINQREIFEQQVKQYEKLVKSLKDNYNYFSETNPEDSFYYNQYEMYASQIDQQLLDTTTLKQYGYLDDQIQQEIIKNDKKKAELYYTAVSSAESSKQQAEVELKILNKQIDALKNGKEDYTVTANASGIIHLMGTLKNGMIIQATNPIASIGTGLDDYKICAYIAASDRPRINEENAVEIEVLGLQQNIYGTILGKISKIDSDITIDEEGNSFFKIEIIPEQNYIVSKEGVKVNLTNGFQVEIRITYNEITYMDYVLDMLGVKK